MNKAFRVVAVSWVALSLSVSAWPAPAPTQERRDSVDTSRAWNDAKTFLKQGAYRQALESLNVILSATPNDTKAQLYRALCEQRLKIASPFTQLSPEELTSLSARLKDEEQAQRRSAAQQKAIERQLKNEQAQWDRDVKALQRQADIQARTEREHRRVAQPPAPPPPPVPVAPPSQPEAAPRQAVVETPQPQPSATPPAAPPSIPPPAPLAPSLQTPPSRAPAPSEERAIEGPGRVSGKRSVELSPVVVQTSPAAGVVPPSPSVEERVLPPPGAVQINAQQMSVSPDRKVAVADGDVEVVFEKSVLTCDHLTLFTDTKDVYAEGRVRLEEGPQVFRGEMAHYNFNTKKGRFLQGTVSAPPWHEHGRSVEHLAEGVYEVTPGYLTSCELEPPHFKFAGHRAIVFAGDRLARARNATLMVEQMPLIYFPWISMSGRQSPFFILPGKKKPWEQFVLMGYRYEGPFEGQQGTLHLDWRRAFGWGGGLDQQFKDAQWGSGLFKGYYNEEQNIREPKEKLPKGAKQNRYRALWRHMWTPLPDTTVVTNIEKYSDTDYRKNFLFRDEYINDDNPESFVSLVQNDEHYSLSALVRKRMNRYETITETYPTLSLSTRSQRVADTNLFASSSVSLANLLTKVAHSEIDTDVVRASWGQNFSYAMNWFQPIQITPNLGVQEVYYSKDKQGGPERPDGRRHLISAQVSSGADASLKLFKVYPVRTNFLGLHINWLRHILTPSVSYSYIRPPTVPNDNLSFGAAAAPLSQMTLGIDNKLQTKRAVEQGGKPVKSVDLARFLISIPYTFRNTQNKQGGRYGDASFRLELFPWPWLRAETSTSYPSHFVKGSRSVRITSWSFDLVAVGGPGQLKAEEAPDLQAPQPRAFEVGPHAGQLVSLLLPQGQWYLGYGHRYSYNDKTEDVIQFDWRLSPKWEIGTFHRFTWKEVAGGFKRFNQVREWQYSLRRDLHDWIAEVVYRVDREFGEELYFTLTLKAYPNFPIQTHDSYHQPKYGSQSSPFSPLHTQTPK